MTLKDLTDYALDALRELRRELDGEPSASAPADNSPADSVEELTQHEAGRDADA
jgi:hypothetical protein